MMRRLLAAAVLVLLAHTANADTDPPPYVAMRTLQNLQEQIAQGNKTAQAAQPQLMAHIADGFQAADPTIWKDPRNARAAVLFLLSGGQPSVIRKILAQTSFPVDIDRLLKGALAYGEGEDEIARTLFEPIDPQSVPSALGAHFALVKANLNADRDPQKAIRLFDTARLLAPGTLIEEAALRREVFVLVDADAIDKAMLLSRQYMRRFKASVYAADFSQRFATAAIRLGVSGDRNKLAQLDSVLGEMPLREKRTLYLAIARSAVVGGRSAEAKIAAEKVLALATPGSSEEVRAKLYRAISLVVSETPADGLNAMAVLDAAKIPPADLALRDAAQAIGAAVQADGPNPSSTADPGASAGDPVQSTIERARNLLAVSDTLLAASRP